MNAAPFFRATVLACLLAASGTRAADYAYVAQPGDTLEGIARQLLKHPGDWAGLQKLNGVAEPRRIPVGTQIRIPRQWLRVDVAPARVGVVQGMARRGGQALVPGGMVAPGDEIATGDDGFVTLELADGSRLVLQPKSRLRLDSLQRTRGVAVYRTRLNLLSGRVDNEVAKQADGTAGYQVRTPAALIAVRGTGFRVAAEEALSRAEVTQGVVAAGKAAGTGRQVPVRAGEGLVVAATLPVGSAVPLLPAPRLEAPSGPWEKVVLRLPFPAVAGAVAYRAQLSKDAEFRQVVAEGLFKSNGQAGAGAPAAGNAGSPPHPQPDPEVKFPSVADGRFWLRLRAVAADGLEGRDTVVALTVKARPEPPFASAPAAGGKVRGENVEFRWSASEEAAAYLLLLSRDGQPVLESGLLKDTVFKPADKLPPGDYAWRVASVRGDGDRGPFGDPVRFTLRPLPPNPEPPKTEGGAVEFAWSGEPGQSFEFEVARDAGFADMLERRTLAESRVSLPRPAGGTYFMRVRATDSDGFVGPWTATQRFEVPSRPWWLLLLLVPVVL